MNNYNVVAVYGLAPIMDRLGRKLENELDPGAIVVSNVFPFPNWRACTDVGNGSSIGRGVYLYRIPECYGGNKENDRKIGCRNSTHEEGSSLG